jgi:hypothetical protein
MWFNSITNKSFRRDQFMIKRVLKEDQAIAVENAAGANELRDQQGQLVGYVSRSPSTQEAAEAKHRLASARHRHTTEQVLNHRLSLEP